MVGLYLLPGPGLVSPLGLGPALGHGLEAGLEAAHPVLGPAPPVPGAVQELRQLAHLDSQLGTGLTMKDFIIFGQSYKSAHLVSASFKFKNLIF